MHPIKIVIETDGRADVHAQSDYERPLTIEGWKIAAYQQLSCHVQLFWLSLAGACLSQSRL